MVNPLARAYSQTSSSGRPFKPRSRTWALPGKSEDKRRGSFGERFSSNSSFMRYHVQTALTIGGEGEARPNVFGRKVGKIVQDLRNGHPAAEIIKYVGDRNARAANTRLSAPDARVNRNSFSVIHDWNLCPEPAESSEVREAAAGRRTLVLHSVSLLLSSGNEILPVCFPFGGPIPCRMCHRTRGR